MEPVLPITLRGDNLGQRHHYLNSRVNQLVFGHVSFEDIEILPELTPVDRIFKIDFANKLKNLDYILNSLKDDDMLYVSRALKSKWLIDRWDIINPKYLEETLFPHMVMPAISKMKHWLYINLSDSGKCREFYLYYKHIKFEYAIKFLIHCDNEVLLKEFSELMTKITPHYLKIFAEKNPKLVQIYFDALATNSDLVQRYLENEESFYNSIKCVLKTDSDVFLDIVEKYHNFNKFTKFSPSMTDYIMSCCKNRFMTKPELYVVHILHIPTVAYKLSVEECKEMVIRLARAKYLGRWFSYKNVEPLVKRIHKEKRSEFKKRVFIDKDIGTNVVECPYEFPASPAITNIDCDAHVFQDISYRPIRMFKDYGFRKMLRKRKAAKWQHCQIVSQAVKSELQKLFDEFRFMGFEQTFHELNDRVNATSSADRRRDMLLVLVSKSGGREESVRALLHLALRHRNEPVHTRAAIVRSLVKRASVWRLPENVWNMILEYGVGLGLNGTKSEAECREGLHAAVLRQVLTTGDCDTLVRTAFLEDFSTLLEYKLTATEQAQVGVSLQNILVTATTNVEPIITTRYLIQLLDVLDAYHINIEESPAVAAVAEFAERNPQLAKPLLERLYNARVGRRKLLQQFLEIKHDDAALVNVLRHNLEVLEPDWFIKLLIEDKTRPNQFLLKLSVYFNEAGGVAEKIRVALQNKIIQELDVRLARPLAMLTCSEKFQYLMCSIEKIDINHIKLSGTLRANMHRSRPAPDVVALGWRRTGIKAVAVRAMRCRPVQVTQIIQTLLKDGTKRTMRLVLALSQRTNCVVDIFAKAVTIRPQAALRAALLYFRNRGEAADLQIWEIVKPSLENLDLRHREGLCSILEKVEWVPKVLKPNYCAIFYLALEKNSNNSVTKILETLLECLPKVSEEFLDKVLVRVFENMSKENPESYPAIVIRYLMLGKSIHDQNKRFDAIGAPFLEKIYSCRVEGDQLTGSFFEENFIQITKSLHYNFAFFEKQHQSCIIVIQRVLKWMQSFLPIEMYFKWYVKIHATMLYFKAIRQSIKLNPEVFADYSRKMSEGVEIVGHFFGRYIVLEVADLKSKYFDSVVELYGNSFTEYLDEYFWYSKSKFLFIAAIIKGMLTENLGCDVRLGIIVLKEHRYNFDNNEYDQLKEFIFQKGDMTSQFLLHAHFNKNKSN